MEEAIRRYEQESQRETYTLLNKLATEIEVKSTHVNLLRADAQLMSSPQINKHLEALEAEISLMKTRKAELEVLTNFTPPEQTTLDLIRLNLKQHAEQLTWEMPEIKGQLLKRYIERIDAINQNTTLALSFKLTNPAQENSILLTKTVAVEIKPSTD